MTTRDADGDEPEEGTDEPQGDDASSLPVPSYIETTSLTELSWRAVDVIQSRKWEIGDMSGNWYAFGEDGTFSGEVDGKTLSGTYTMRVGEDALGQMDVAVANDIRKECENRGLLLVDRTFFIRIKATGADGTAVPEEFYGIFESTSLDNDFLDTLWLADANQVGTYTPVNNLPGTLRINGDGSLVAEDA